MNTPQYWAIAYYHFTHLEDPEKEMSSHKKFFENRDIKGRIYLSQQGINGQISASPDAGKEYIAWMRSKPEFQKVEFKVQLCQDHAFYKMVVKVRPQLVAFDVPVDLSKRGEHVAPALWRKMLEEKGEDTILVDVRNSYESDVGYFEGAILPPCETFREFPAYAEELKKKVDPEKGKVMMYCTGGIRCEYYSAFLKEKGFKNIFQLDGGVINYGLKEGTKHWKGKLFVFDDRLVAPIHEENGEVISLCRHCSEKTDTYYNCANMDCNELYVCCKSCAKEFAGCCSPTCAHSPRVRPYDGSEHPKPFRKWPHEEKLRMKSCGCAHG